MLLYLSLGGIIQIQVRIVPTHKEMGVRKKSISKTAESPFGFERRARRFERHISSQKTKMATPCEFAGSQWRYT